MQIPHIIKALENEDHAKNMCEGNFILSSIDLYKRCPYKYCENVKKGRYESPTKIGPIDYSMGNPAFIFCAHEKIHYESSRYGNAFVKINRPCELFEEIKKNYQEWDKSKTGSQGKHHWLELHLKVDKSYFELVGK